MRTLRLILSFYRSFAFASITLTFACISIVYTNGIGAFTVVFWFKMATLGLIFYFINNYKKHELYYYKNLGVSRWMLWIPTLTFDFILFIVLTILIHNIS